MSRRKKVKADNSFEVYFTVPGLPPSLNRAMRKRPQKYFTTWLKDAINAAKLSNVNDLNIDCHVHVTVIFFAPQRGSWDIDNRLKIAIDFLCKAGILVDDHQIISLYATLQHNDIEQTGFLIKPYTAIMSEIPTTFYSHVTIESLPPIAL